MSPERKLERMCHRHGVPFEIGERLLPLVRRALEARGERRRRLLAVVEATLAQDSEELRRRRRLEAYLDERYLVAVATVLHHWELDL